MTESVEDVIRDRDNVGIVLNNVIRDKDNVGIVLNNLESMDNLVAMLIYLNMLSFHMLYIKFDV